MNKNQDNPTQKHSKGFVLLGCTVVLFACLVLFITQLLNYIKVKDASLNPEAPPQAAAPTEAIEENRSDTPVILSATSTLEDLYIVVRTEQGHAIEGNCFSLDICYPNGSVFSYSTDPDGSLYLEDLPGGEYFVSMPAQNGYLSTETLLVQVKAPTAQLSFSDGSYILDDKGNVTFSYSFNTDADGYLYYKNSDKPSDVLPVQSDSGEYYGFRFISPNSFLSDESTALHIERVELIRPDNTVNDLYDIQAEPIPRPEGQLSGWQSVDGRMYYTDSSGRRLTGYRRIDGKKYFFDDSGVKCESLGVDVSSFNDSINWTAAKQNGIDFAILRAGGRGWSSGRPYIDAFFHDYYREAKEAGMKLGLYFYSTAITPEEAVEEANFVLRRLNHMPLDLPIYFDSEYSGDYPEGRADMLSIFTRTHLARAFCETIEMAGYEAGVYASQNFFGTTLDYLPVCQYSIWLANYTRDLSLPSFYYDYDMWQFTESGTVNGFSGTVDLNVVFYN